MSLSSVSRSRSNSPVNGNGAKYIEHRVSKMDTLAGIAIKYGVEVADIRKLNNLATDLQIFALKTLQIPLPGRHPPSPNLSNGSASSRENGSKRRARRGGSFDIMEALQSQSTDLPKQKVSPAMSTLQKYYGLKPPSDNSATEGIEMAVYTTSSSDDFNDGMLQKASSEISCCHLKSRKSADDFLAENKAITGTGLAGSGDAENEKSSEKAFRRRQKSEADFRAGTLKEENAGGNGGFSPIMGNSLAMRTKAASRTTLPSDSGSGWLNSIPVGLGDSILTDGLAGIIKSSTVSSLQDQDHNTSSFWPSSRWSLKPDLQALSTVAIARPILDSLQKPMAGRRKAALD